MDRRRFLGAMGAWALLPMASRGWAGDLARARVTGYRVEREPGGTRLVLDLSDRVSYRVFTLPSPARVVVDLDGVAAPLPAWRGSLENTPVAAVRSARHGQGLRIVLDMRQAAHPLAVMRPDAAGRQQLQVRLASAGAAAASTVQHVRRPAIVAIDAGHGGKDPGAVSASNHYEKHVALAVASRLYGLLRNDPQFQPTMIRDDDRFVPLQERVLIAHRRHADLFVSIHADAAPVPSARGASVYVLSQHGASSTMARWLARSENSADRFDSPQDSALYSRDPMLSKVLVDMSMDATIASSLDLGRLMLDELGQVTRIHQQRVDQAAFAVLKSPDIPSILVETGFMSNRDDCLRLLSDRHQEDLAASLCSGIRGYFHQFPVPDVMA